MMSTGRGRDRAFTKVELLAVVLVLVIAALLAIPAWFRTEAKRNRITCVNNLKYFGLATRVFSTAQQEDVPWNHSVAEGGTKELLNDPEQTWRHFIGVSNEVGSPLLFRCPSDRQRLAATTFTNQPDAKVAVVFNSNLHLSYFLGPHSFEDQPDSIRAGDRNVSTNGIPLAPGRHVLDAGTQLGFTTEMHNLSGNILLGDGSVQQVTGGRLTQQFAAALKSTGLTTNVWLIP